MHQNKIFHFLCFAAVAASALGVQAAAQAGTVYRGLATWYGPGFSGWPTADGETFNPRELTAAHPFLPFGTQVRVTDLDNNRTVVVRINDRPGNPAIAIDLSQAAAEILGMTGSAPVKLEVLGR